LFAPRRGKRVGLSRKMIRRNCFSIMSPPSSVVRRAEDEDKRRKLSCTRCAVSCAGCAMDEAQREVRARSASSFFGDKLEDGREAQGRDERGGAGPRRARSKWRREHHRASGRFGTTGPRRLSTSSSPVFNTSSKSYGRRRVLGGATGALGALPGGGASGAGRGGRRQREAVAARGAQAGQAAKGRRRRSTELRRRAPCSSRRNGPRRRRAEMSETAQGRDERGGAGLR
jgi:hypothetical protein